MTNWLRDRERERERKKKTLVWFSSSGIAGGRTGGLERQQKVERMLLPFLRGDEAKALPLNCKFKPKVELFEVSRRSSSAARLAKLDTIANFTLKNIGGIPKGTNLHLCAS